MYYFLEPEFIKLEFQVKLEYQALYLIKLSRVPIMLENSSSKNVLHYQINLIECVSPKIFLKLCYLTKKAYQELLIQQQES